MPILAISAAGRSASPGFRRHAGAFAQLSRPRRVGSGQSGQPRKPILPDVSRWALIPVVLIATAATIIASQAVITGAYSLTRQAIQLKLLPRMRVFHTSETQSGQIYMPIVNVHSLSALSSGACRSELFGPGKRLRHCCHRNDGGYCNPGHRCHPPALAMVVPGGLALIMPFLIDRSRVSRSQSDEGPRRRLCAAFSSPRAWVSSCGPGSWHCASRPQGPADRSALVRSAGHRSNARCRRSFPEQRSS